jgi:hypothetical protein
VAVSVWRMAVLSGLAVRPRGEEHASLRVEVMIAVLGGVQLIPRNVKKRVGIFMGRKNVSVAVRSRRVPAEDVGNDEARCERNEGSESDKRAHLETRESHRSTRVDQRDSRMVEGHVVVLVQDGELTADLISIRGRSRGLGLNHREVRNPRVACRTRPPALPLLPNDQCIQLAIRKRTKKAYLFYICLQDQRNLTCYTWSHIYGAW